ncbi:T9SS type A sorting domain-containing protein [Flavobacterium sp. '19STA2R22 D10 B1']|uniref:T9SS type A sorting domain-containing protein n=1 Tax=Flavobacterium aerium TaxID=3037261 RepID=UPI00278C8606|nr:T9SS type A sorting domain-containing protein [Flavobacterium sp. '19STA2R22 D10 B1']
MGGKEGNISLYYQKSPGSGVIRISNTISAPFFGSNFVSRNFSFTLLASAFNNTGGAVFAEYVSYSGSIYKSSDLKVVKTLVPPITNNTITQNQTIYYGQIPSMLTGTNPNGGTGTYTYQWDKNDGVNNWVQINGATSNIYTPEALTRTTKFRRYALSGGRANSSNEITIQVNDSPLITNNEISGNQTINEGNSGANIFGSQPSGGNGSGTYTYQWEKKEVNGSWNIVEGATTGSLMPGSLLVTTNYRRLTKSGNANSISNEVTINVIAAPQLLSNSIILNGSLISGSLPIGGTGLYSYFWTLYSPEDPIIIQGIGLDLIIPDFVYDYLNQYPNLYINRTVTSGIQSITSNSIQVIPGTQILNNSIALNGLEITGSLPNGGLGQGFYTYEWYSYNMIGDEVIGEVNKLVGDQQNYTITQIPGMITKYYRIVKSGGKKSFSNTVSYDFSGRQISTFENLNITEQEQSITVKVYPNPTNGLVNFQNDVWENKEVEIIIYSEWLGNSSTIYKGVVKPNQGINWNIPVNYPKGLYFYKIVTGEEIKSGKIFYN